MKFKTGETYYTVNGEEVVFEAEIGGQNFVRKVYEHEGDAYNLEPPYTELGPLSTTGKLFEKPPTARLHSSVTTLREQLERTRKDLVDVHDEVTKLEAKRLDLEAEAEKHEEFRLLLDYLDGKITHVVLPDYSECDIRELEDILEDEDRGGYYRDRWPHALGLFAIPNDRKIRDRRVTWKVNQYGCGSGRWGNFIPCYSEEDARDRVREQFEEKLDLWRNPVDGSPSPVYDIKKLLGKNDWLEAPEDWLQYQEDLKMSNLEKRHAELRSELADLEAEMSGSKPAKKRRKP